MIDTTLFSARLEEEKEKLETELAAHGKKTLAGDWQGSAAPEMQEADPNTVADNIEELATNVSVVEELEHRYREVLAALDRIAQGTYGTCEVGGEEIVPGRLEANPAARTCTEHA